MSNINGCPVFTKKKQNDDYFDGFQLNAIYCSTKLNMLVGILVTYACNQTC